MRWSFVFLHLPRQPLDFASRDDVLVHHAHEKLFDRTGSEALDDVADGAGGDAGGGDVGPIDEGITGHLMAEVSASFEAAQ